jgi:hypothetical protein
MTIPQEWFGRLDLIVAGVVILVVIITLLANIPSLARYAKIKSM